MDSNKLKKLESEIRLLEMQMEMTDLDGGDSSYYKKQLDNLKSKRNALDAPDIDITY